jgi:hypothetical protein
MAEENKADDSMKILLETVNKLTEEIKELKAVKTVEPTKSETLVDPLEQEKAKMEQEKAIKKELEENFLFERSVQSFNDDWGKIAENEHDIATIDKLNASSEYKLGKKLEAIFNKEENQNILSKDMLNKFKEFQSQPEEDRHKNIKNFYVALKNNFFENLEKLEVQKAKLIQNGAIKDENKRPVVDKLVDRALNNPKIKAIE